MSDTGTEGQGLCRNRLLRESGHLEPPAIPKTDPESIILFVVAAYFFGTMANEGSRVRVLLLPVIVILATMAFSIAPMSVASTPTIDSSGSVNGCGSSNNSGCTYWWDYSLWGNLYPGQTVYFDFAVYNTAPCGCSVQILSLIHI